MCKLVRPRLFCFRQLSHLILDFRAFGDRMTVIPAALALMLEHAVCPISAVTIVGIVFPARLRIAVWCRALLEGWDWCELLTFTLSWHTHWFDWTSIGGMVD